MAKCNGLTGKVKKLCEEDKLLISGTIFKSVEEDNFEEGAEPNSRRDILAETVTAEDMADLKKKISNYGIDLDEFYIFDEDDPETHRLEFNRNEDDDGNPITLSKSRPKGWLADYSLYLNFYQKIPADLKSMGFKEM